MGIGSIARRTFLIGSAAMAGGVAFGVYAVNRPIANPLLKDLKDGEATFNPFVKVDANTITLITPRADKGQGAYSIQAHLIAEELDVDPAKVTLTPGMPDAAYYNSAVMEEGSPFPAYDHSAIANSVRGSMGALPKLLGMQMTGGSSTVPDGFVRFRTAGAVARETLKEAAARRAGVSRIDCKTDDGHVILPNGDKIAYTALAGEAAGIEPITDVILREKSEWKYLGKELGRIDMVPKCTGTEKYGIDLRMDGMVYASVRANPGIGGEVKSFDATQAEKMPGVQKIVPVRSGVGVVATNTWYAIEAVNAIEIDWAPGPYPAASEEMWTVLADHMTDDHFDHAQRNDGDPEGVIGEAVEAEYRVPYLAHAPLEPMNAVALFNTDKLEIWTGTQIPGYIRTHAADLAGLDVDQVFVYAQPMGGSFGRRLEDTYVMQTVELAMAMAGTPVKMTWSREEDMTHDYPRPMALGRASGKVKDGKVESFDLKVSQASLMTSWFGRLMGMGLPGPDATITTGSWDQPWDIPNYRVSGYRAPEMVPISSWRSVGASGNGFLHETFMDELINKAGADPMAERLRLCVHEPSIAVLNAAKEMSSWSSSKTADNQGMGLAFTMSFGVPVALVTQVTSTDDGIKIDKVWAACDVGRVLDPVNLEAQIQGGIIFGMGHAMNCELTYADYGPEQDNYHAFEGMRLYQAPEIEVQVLTNLPKIKGIGEPGVPPAAPSLGNAIFAATGIRLREMPFNKFVDFV